VYFVNPKVACTSIRIALMSQEEMHEVSNCKPEHYKHYKWFTFVRHPMSRVVSTYHNIIENWFDWEGRARTIEFDQTQNIYQFMECLVENIGNGNWHFTPQHMNFDVKHMDFIGKFERLVQEWRTLCLPSLQKFNQSKHKPWLEYCYDNRGKIKPIIRKLEKTFETDFRLFGYETLSHTM
jgi:hypothetical protein